MNAPSGFIRIGTKLRHAHAPVVGRPDGQAVHFDGYVKDCFACGTCHYLRCSCQVIDAEFSDVDEPPKDVLPEGWTDISTEDQESYRHWRGVHAWRTRSRAHAGMHAWGWCWALSDRATCRRDDCKPTRELAMAAALQSVTAERARPIREAFDRGQCFIPAEPALRPGWQWDEGDKRWDHQGIGASVYQSSVWGTWVAIKWGGRAEPGHPTLEAAMIRAEALARGEP